MTKEQKQIFLSDLSARLPYNLIVQIEGCGIWNLRGIDHDDSAELRDRVIVWHGKNYPSSKNSFPIINCKPYLFPLSSMTEEQKEDLLLTVVGEDGLKLFSVTKDGIISNDEKEQSLENFCFNNINFSNETIESYIDWLNKNHFDYRGLIEKGLAIDATNINCYNN